MSIPEPKEDRYPYANNSPRVMAETYRETDPMSALPWMYAACRDADRTRVRLDELEKTFDDHSGRLGFPRDNHEDLRDEIERVLDGLKKEIQEVRDQKMGPSSSHDLDRNGPVPPPGPGKRADGDPQQRYQFTATLQGGEICGVVGEYIMDYEDHIEIGEKDDVVVFSVMKHSLAYVQRYDDGE